jgi:hypothetical protein
MRDDRNKPVWPWIVVLLIGLPMLYVVSFGPACWIADSGFIDFLRIRPFYRPLRRHIWHCPTPIVRTLCWWGNLGCESPLVAETHLIDIEVSSGLSARH